MSALISDIEALETIIAAVKEEQEENAALRDMLRECRDGFEVIWGCAIDKVVADIAERNIAKLTAELGEK